MGEVALRATELLAAGHSGGDCVILRGVYFAGPSQLDLARQLAQVVVLLQVNGAGHGRVELTPRR